LCWRSGSQDALATKLLVRAVTPELAAQPALAEQAVALDLPELVARPALAVTPELVAWRALAVTPELVAWRALVASEEVVPSARTTATVPTTIASVRIVTRTPFASPAASTTEFASSFPKVVSATIA